MAGNITAGNQSGESLHLILPSQPYPHAMSIVSGVEGPRPGLQSRKTSRSSMARARSSPGTYRSLAENASPTSPVASSDKKRFRLSAIIPFLLSATAFSFSLVLVLAGSKAGNMTNVNILSVRLHYRFRMKHTYHFLGSSIPQTWAPESWSLLPQIQVQ